VEIPPDWVREECHVGEKIKRIQIRLREEKDEEDKGKYVYKKLGG
jgi:hypothetical protein